MYYFQKIRIKKKFSSWPTLLIWTYDQNATIVSFWILEHHKDNTPNMQLMFCYLSKVVGWLSWHLIDLLLANLKGLLFAVLIQAAAYSAQVASFIYTVHLKVNYSAAKGWKQKVERACYQWKMKKVIAADVILFLRKVESLAAILF